MSKRVIKDYGEGGVLSQKNPVNLSKDLDIPIGKSLQIVACLELGRRFFHLAQNDYLSTLATVLRFFEETINDNKTTPEMRELQLKSIKGVINDLLYLNKHYVVVPKDQSKMD